ncbi:MAG: response regulator [Leptolyngbyaceae cyanobacterium MAG.088]|nr:response regulator [Leptolyngbyaceae cyanobacterium MAG.088]
MTAPYSSVDVTTNELNSTIQGTDSFIEQLSTVDEKTVVRVLLVDDQPIVAESIRRLLASEPDIQLHYCNDAQKAIPMATQIQPTVILQDLVMPDADGLMLLKFFRANPTTSTIPVIVLSTRDEPVVKAEAFATGANDYLVKIPDPIEFIARLKYHSSAYANLLKRHEAERVRAYNRDLERRVADRTAELEIALMELKTAQSRIIQEEKMAGVGQLVSGICHELNNPVSFIQGNLEPAQDYCDELLQLVALYQQVYPEPPEIIQAAIDQMDLEFITEDFTKLLQSFEHGANRISNIVLSLRNFSRLDEGEIKSVDLHEGIDHALLLLGSRLQSIEVIKNYDLKTLVECLPGHLNQVFMHILSNAVDALKGPSHTQALNQNDELCARPLQIHIQTRLLDDNAALISFTDNGPGISQEIMNRIFEPFFTTKPVGQGTGLGLSLSYQTITEYHGGSLECHSTPGQSTTFIIKIPLHQTKNASVLFGQTKPR